jgi:electron transfer flavoprotein alpha subunit
MKTLLVLECREGRLREESYELLGFADALGAGRAMVLIGGEGAVPAAAGRLYLADPARYGDYDPDQHARVIVEVAQREESDCVVFVHSSYGWDLAPRVASALSAAQVTEVLGVREGAFEVGCCNGKLRRTVVTDTGRVVLTVQGGAFACSEAPDGVPEVIAVEVATAAPRIELVGYEAAEKKTVDLGSADVVVSAGRGVGKKDNISVIADLAKALGGELGASRPVVDAGWLDHSHQVGSTGQVVKPKLYVACGISGAIQHLAGMKGADYVIAINKDKDAPIGEVADVLVVADVMQFVPALTERMQKYALAG